MEITLTEEARQAWVSFAAQHGLTMTALGEAIASELARNLEKPNALWRQIIADGKAVRAERGNRAQPD